jgi:hypothetical protein
MDDGPVRRISDKIARWIEVILLSAIAAFTGVIVYFYGGMPGQISELVLATSNMQLEIRYMKEELRDLKDAARVSQDWRTRQVLIEERTNRHADQLADQQRRLNALEARGQRVVGKP